MLTGSASAHLVTYSTAVIIYLAPVLFSGIGNGPMKSMAQISNFKLGFTDIKGISVLIKVLSLQETPLGCSSRMPGNLNCVLGFF